MNKLKDAEPRTVEGLRPSLGRRLEHSFTTNMTKPYPGTTSRILHIQEWTKCKGDSHIIAEIPSPSNGCRPEYTLQRIKKMNCILEQEVGPHISCDGKTGRCLLMPCGKASAQRGTQARARFHREQYSWTIRKTRAVLHWKEWKMLRLTSWKARAPARPARLRTL